MRIIGKMDSESAARTFSDHLTRLNIENELVEESDGSFEIWIISEDDLPYAERLFAQFLESPDSGEYRDASKEAKKIKKQKEKEAKDKVPYIDVRTKVFGKQWARRGTLTLFLILVSGLFALFSNLGTNDEFLSRFFITGIQTDGFHISWYPGLPEIMRGEFWRVLTPIFIHFGPMHLIFNLMWLYDLGNMIEDRKSTWFLGLFVLVTGIAGNLAQYAVSHPKFGGMSGVVYGLLGYAWMKSRYDPNSRIFLHKTTVIWMIGWFFLCFTGLVGNIANAAHTAGLVIGVAWGFLTSPRFTRYLKK